MKTTLSFDRCEGRLAVLLTDEGQQIHFPKELLPKEAKPGDMLAFAIGVDREATEALKEGHERVAGQVEEDRFGEGY